MRSIPDRPSQGINLVGQRKNKDLARAIDPALTREEKVARLTDYFDLGSTLAELKLKAQAKRDQKHPIAGRLTQYTRRTV